MGLLHRRPTPVGPNGRPIVWPIPVSSRWPPAVLRLLTFAADERLTGGYEIGPNPKDPQIGGSVLRTLGTTILVRAADRYIAPLLDDYMVCPLSSSLLRTSGMTSAHRTHRILNTIPRIAARARLFTAFRST